MKTKSLYPYLVTENMDETVRFYTEALGFSVKHDAVRADGGHVVVLSNEAGYDLELMDAVNTPPFVLKAGDHGLRMNVEDIDAACAELKEKGFTVPAAPIETKIGKHLPVKDPIGTSITLIQHIHNN